jgi:hypothetical protein
MTQIKKDETICYVLSDDPLFTGSGQPTQKTERLREACLTMFLSYASHSL